uniref:AlNc14C8G1050 protein n=1 Tax=Albugo laibachii Nc14 TaxID=890382 RepID=F0W1X1_9STRA|nr:AlNc14C8G1050 [Albugo laibachii Nc14]|eukprot:CCA15050.1 AlNc14C8G1050 [Albugo laibachii Nc14]
MIKRLKSACSQRRVVRTRPDMELLFNEEHSAKESVLDTCAILAIDTFGAFLFWHASWIFTIEIKRSEETKQHAGVAFMNLALDVLAYRSKGAPHQLGALTEIETAYINDISRGQSDKACK